MLDENALKTWISTSDKVVDLVTETGLNSYIRVKDLIEHIDEVVEAMRQIEKIPSIEFYDKEEIIEGCTVQILTNTRTGQTSVGWWRS